MNRRPNRTILILVSLLLLALGLLPLLAAAGILPFDEPAELYGQMTAEADAYAWAWLLGIVVGGLLLAVLGGWLVARQFRVRPGGRLDTVVVQDEKNGRTTLQAAAAADAAAADLRRNHSITDSNVRMVTFGSRPRLLVDLDISTETDLDRALEAAEEVYQRLAGALGVETVSVDTRLRPTRTRQSRVQ